MTGTIIDSIMFHFHSYLLKSKSILLVLVLDKELLASSLLVLVANIVGNGFVLCLLRGSFIALLSLA